MPRFLIAVLLACVIAPLDAIPLHVHVVSSQTTPAESEKIKAEVEAAVHPYFERAKAVLQPEQHQILALTCMQGAATTTRDEMITIAKRLISDQAKSITTIGGDTDIAFVEPGHDAKWIQVKQTCKDDEKKEMTASLIVRMNGLSWST